MAIIFNMVSSGCFFGMNPGIYCPLLVLGGLGLGPGFLEDNSASIWAIVILVNSEGTMPLRLQASMDLGEENLTWRESWLKFSIEIFYQSSRVKRKLTFLDI